MPTKQPQDNYPQFSERISEFCDLLDEAGKDYDWNVSEVKRLDQLTQDYLHMLEMEELSYHERAKIATQLAECRKLRRDSKDTTEILAPLINFLDSEKGKNMVNLLREVLGKTRKVERQMETRMYAYRVHDDGGKNYIYKKKAAPKEEPKE